MALYDSYAVTTPSYLCTAFAEYTRTQEVVRSAARGGDAAKFSGEERCCEGNFAASGAK